RSTLPRRAGLGVFGPRGAGALAPRDRVARTWRAVAAEERTPGGFSPGRAALPRQPVAGRWRTFRAPGRAALPRRSRLILANVRAVQGERRYPGGVAWPRPGGIA